MWKNSSHDPFLSVGNNEVWTLKKTPIPGTFLVRPVRTSRPMFSASFSALVRTGRTFVRECGARRLDRIKCVKYE